MSSTSSALLKHGSPTNRIAYTFVPILINSCIFLMVPLRFSGLFTQICRRFYCLDVAPSRSRALVLFPSRI